MVNIYLNETIILTLFLWAFNEAYLTVPLKPAAVLGVLTSPLAVVNCLAKP